MLFWCESILIVTDIRNILIKFFLFRDCLAFAAEPVFASLANILGRRDNMPLNNESVTKFKLYDVEIKYGLLQVFLYFIYFY